MPTQPKIFSNNWGFSFFMKIIRTKRFEKCFNKRIKNDPSLVNQFKKCFLIFEKEENHPLLKTHFLKGNLSGYKAFSISGDIRVIYKKEKDTIILYDIGIHNQVYK